VDDNEFDLILTDTNPEVPLTSGLRDSVLS
jgi:hypothetical protein